MAVFNEPTKWAQSLGATANADVIPDEAGAMDVDISKIFPSVFSVPLSQGGKAIPRRTLNGILKLLGDWLYYYQQGGVASYSDNVDYVPGRVVLYNDKLWRCIKANGTDDPQTPAGGEFWTELSDSSSSPGLLPNQIIISPVPMSDANLHLLDGSLLTSGVYAEYVAMMIGLYNADPTASCWISESDWQTSVSTYGECGKFVVDTVNETVRLPKLTSFIQATSIANELGSLTEAGVPNITGYITNMLSSQSSSGTAGALSRSPSGESAWSSGQSGFYNKINFDASNSNAIYGNSTTVQPQAIKYYYYIVVGTVSKTPVQVDIDNVATDLNGKADRSLSNVDNPGRIAMAHNAMPSNKYVELTLGASGSQYTAPADGYFTIQATFSVPFGYIHLVTLSATTGVRVLCQLLKGNSSNSNNGSFILVQKGDMLQIDYASIANLHYFGFVYAVGSESEQV